MPSVDTLPRGTQGLGSSPTQPTYRSPNASQPNRVRGRQARTAANARARGRGTNSGSANARRAANLRNARAAQNPVTAPRPPVPGTPTAPIPKGIPIGGAGAATSAGATGAIWTATPASVPVATAIAAPIALGGGLAIGNAIYEDFLGRPFGPSLGDTFFPRETPQRDGPVQPYEGPGPQTTPRGQCSTLYAVGVDYGPGSLNGQETADSTASGAHRGPFSNFRRQLSPNGQKWEWLIDGANQSDIFLGSVFKFSYPDPSGSPTFLRQDGQPDNCGLPTSTPQPQSPNQPYSPRNPLQEPPRLPQPLDPARPLQPASPQPAPDSNPQPTPTPYLESRPNPDENSSPLPFPPLIPAYRPSPRATPTPTPAQPPTPTTPPPSSRQRPNCGCNAGIISGVGRQLDPIRQQQQQIVSNLGGEALSTGLILQRLQQMQKFAETAWKSTKVDKIINMLTLFTVLHNGAHLSRNLAETLGDVLSNGLAIVGIDDAEGNRLDVNEVVGSTASNWIKALIGEEIYENTKAGWLKLSRVYQSGANILFSVRSILDSTQEVAEFTAENTGRIGNALKKSGVVNEDSYKWMPENVTAQNATRRKFDRIFEGIDQVDDKLGSLQNVTGEVLDIQEELTEIGEGRQQFTKAVEELVPRDVPENKPVADAVGESKTASASPEIADADLEADE